MAIVLKYLKFNPIYHISRRSIMNTSRQTQKVMEDLQENPYFDKYANKIAALQKTKPEEFVKRIENKLNKEKEPSLETAKKRYDSVLKPKSPLTVDRAPVQKKLEDILKIELVEDKDVQEITSIWNEYHLQKDVIAATIPNSLFDKMENRANKYPTFLFPLPRSQGYEFIMCQAYANTVHFTTLLCYQVHKENAPECLTIVHYKELMENKGVVLMRGEFDKNVISAQEAQCLANQYQMFYGQDIPSKLNLLETFTNKPDNFKHMDLIAELENLQIG